MFLDRSGVERVVVGGLLGCERSKRYQSLYSLGMTISIYIHALGEQDSMEVLSRPPQFPITSNLDWWGGI